MRDLGTNTMVCKSALGGYRPKIIRFKRNQQFNHDNKRKRYQSKLYSQYFHLIHIRK